MLVALLQRGEINLSHRPPDFKPDFKQCSLRNQDKKDP